MLYKLTGKRESAREKVRFSLFRVAGLAGHEWFIRGHFPVNLLEPLEACDNLTGVLPMETTRLSTKGQIILPKSIRDSRDWRAGTAFIVEEMADGVFLRPKTSFPATKLEDVAGCLRSKRKPPTAKQIRAAVAREVSRRHDRGRY
jgi:AbrB family looped-hinge helix DNA binding protein